jgi:hypothetical protein
MDTTLEWVGYVHKNGTVHTKRVLSMHDVPELKRSDNVLRVYGPFNERSRQLAVAHVKAMHKAAPPLNALLPTSDESAEAVDRLIAAVLACARVIGNEATTTELANGIHVLSKYRPAAGSHLTINGDGFKLDMRYED